MLRPHLRQPLPVRVIRAKPLFQNRNPAFRLARFLGFGAGQIIKTTARMGFDIGKRLVLLGKVIEHVAQQSVLLHIGQISGVIDMLV